MNQRQAVYNATIQVLSNKGITFEKGQIAATMLTKEDHASIRNIVKQGFANGSIEFKDTESNKNKLNNASELNKYVVGLVNNWLRKDPELNGGNKYESKNPGSRPADAQIKELKKVLSVITDESKKAIVQAAIDKRQAEINATKATKTIEIDTSVLPEDIASLLDE